MESTSAKRHLMPLAYGRARATDGADAREAEAEPLQSGRERVLRSLHVSNRRHMSTTVSGSAAGGRVKEAEWTAGSASRLCPTCRTVVLKGLKSASVEALSILGGPHLDARRP